MDLPQEINSLDDLIKLVQSGLTDFSTFGEVNTKIKDDLILFNYTASAQFAGRWNYFERISRGLILNRKTGEVVARPFDKFFNWGENNQTTTAPIKSITEKYDGSLGILYRHDGEFKIATRGSFDSKQATWATEFLKQHRLDSISPRWTLLFEIIYPDNRVVVDYGNWKALVLLAARDRFTGKYLSYGGLHRIAHDCGFAIAYKDNYFCKPEDILLSCKSLDTNHEGWVVEFEDGQRFKFKGEQYRELHRIITGLSFKRVVEAIINNTVSDLRDALPDDFRVQVDEWIDKIGWTLTNTYEAIMRLHGEASINIPTTDDWRKHYAQYVLNKRKDLAKYAFALLDNKDVPEMILNDILHGKLEVQGID